MVDAAFLPLPDGRFAPTEAAHSPWGEGLLHGGPPAGLLAREVERLLAGSGLQVARLTVDLMRPIPAVPLGARAGIARLSRRLAVVEASLIAGEEEVTRAVALMLRPLDGAGAEARGGPPHSPAFDETVPVGRLADVFAEGDGRAGVPARGRPGFHTTIEVRKVLVSAAAGHAVAWIRVPLPLVAGEELTPLVRAAATADFGNALASVHRAGSLGFINADIGLSLHRYPAGEWLCLDTRSTVEASGIGLSESVLFDRHGAAGRVVQSRLANPRG